MKIVNDLSGNMQPSSPLTGKTFVRMNLCAMYVQYYFFINIKK